MNIPRRAIGPLGIAFVVFFVLPLLVPATIRLLRPADKAEELGEVEASAVYQGEDGSLRMLRVMKHSTAQDDVFVLLSNDLQAKQLLGEPQRIVLPRAQLRQAARLRSEADGQLSLLLNDRQWWLRPANQATFAPMDAALRQRFAAELGTGVSKYAFGEVREPGLLDVTSNTGDRYALYWASGELYPWADRLPRWQQRPWAQYQQTVSRIDYADFDTDVAQYGLPTMLLQFAQKVRPGEFERWPRLSVHSSSDKQVRAAPKLYQPLSDGFVVSRQAVRDAGITKIAPVTSVPVQFSGEVLARNADRVLMRYDETPTTAAEVVLQIVDTHSLQVVWRKSTREIPQLLSDGSVVAQAWPGGFYLSTAMNLPALVIDNDGQTLYDFQPQKRQEQPSDD
ncbi:hypothetical protein [Comamonas sp. JUb58]|uniref:hypothetical protein n=1 Tax=Comamonas sp. JUb58 TaxID=2485114 RepID=UPI00105CBEFA|nr:hypothetical protein [Comamonas sp. JUb58]TDS76301.1 hypothetical protein EDF71_114100 [Comamonas sp. JUb58]